MKELEQAKIHLANCYDWTNTAMFLGAKEHNNALQAEWEAMKDVARLEQSLKNFPINLSRKP